MAAFEAEFNLARVGNHVTGGIDPALLAELDKFEQDSLSAGHHPDQVKHAICRFLGPFCAWSRSNGRCTGWHQLSKANKRIVFKNGLAAEGAWLGNHLRNAPTLPPAVLPPPVVDPAIARLRAERDASQRRRRG